jgi:hypothetical protein
MNQALYAHMNNKRKMKKKIIKKKNHMEENKIEKVQGSGIGQVEIC